jgi:hypothetical protein
MYRRCREYSHARPRLVPPLGLRCRVKALTWYLSEDESTPHTLHPTPYTPRPNASKGLLTVLLCTLLTLRRMQAATNRVWGLGSYFTLHATNFTLLTLMHIQTVTNRAEQECASQATPYSQVCSNVSSKSSTAFSGV